MMEDIAEGRHEAATIMPEESLSVRVARMEAEIRLLREQTGD